MSTKTSCHMGHGSKVLTASLFLLILLLGASLAAQNPYGRITGRVVDASGAVVAGAAIRAVQLGTNIAATATTSANGVYDLPNLLPGNYRVEVTMPGFKRYERSAVEVRLGDTLGLDIAVEVGAVQEKVIVTTESPILETTAASFSQTLTSKTLMDSPLGGRSLTYLMQLAPTMVATSPPMHGWLPQARGYDSAFLNGASASNTNEFTIDGTPNMDRGGTMAFVPPPEMIEEVRVETAGYDASIGHMLGAQVNMIFKSGSNDVHGSLFFSHVSRPLMSNPFFVNKALYDLSTGPPTKAKQDSLYPYNMTNRYRGSLGGPVYIPKVYDGRNRTFLSYGNDFMLRMLPTTEYDTVPSAKERAGDFSDLLALGSQYQIYDPLTIAAAPNGRFSRQPLAGNVIPSARINPIARKLTELYPVPNVTGTSDGRNNLSAGYSDRTPFALHMVRVDHVITPSHRLYGSVMWSKTRAGQGRTFFTATGLLQNDDRFNVVLDDVFTPRPDLVVNLRAGIMRLDHVNAPYTVGVDLAQYGFSSNLLSMIDQGTSQLPAINVDGMTAFGTEAIDRWGHQNTYLGGNIAHVRGSHSLKAGGDWRVIQSNDTAPGRVSPSYTFGSDWTKGPLDTSAAAPIGQGLASFMFGFPTSGFTDRNASYAETSKYFSVFFQDDWKATRKLTVSAGLRYEVELPTTERYNRTVRGFDLNAASPISAAALGNYTKSPIPQVPVSQFKTLGGLLFAGVNGVPRTLWDTDANNFSPRLGLAYHVLPKVVVRAGYGVFFGTLGDRTDVYQQGFSQRTNLVPSPDNGLTFRGTLGDPFPDGVLQPAGSSAGMKTALGQAPSFYWAGAKLPYVQRWSFDVQRELPYRMLVDVGYVGNRATGLGVTRAFDSVPAQYLSTSPVRDQAAIDFLAVKVANPFYGLPEFSGTTLSTATVNRSQLLIPMPQFTSVGATLSNGFSWYHAATVRVDKRFARGYSLQGVYTWAKNMEATQYLNPTDAALTHSISSADRPHHIVISGMWDVPWARTRLWGGWSLNAIYQWQSGAPIGFANIIFNGDLHDIVLPASDRTVEKWFNTDAGFNRISAQQLASNIRTFPLRLTGLRADNWNYWDISVIKSFRIREHLKFELRGEAVDAFNSPIFNAPNSVPTNTLFGQVTSTIWTEQRKITVVGKLSW